MFMDHDAPILECNVGQFGDTISTGFSIYTYDKFGNAKLYYKSPSDTEFRTSGSDGVGFTAYAKDGKYYFYAEDAMGNRSETVWIELYIPMPTVEIVSSNTENKTYITWTGDYLVKVNGNAYTKETWITAEGDYDVYVLDNATGRSKTYYFSILHCYEKIETIPPTCMSQGYTLYECSSCDDYYYTDFVEAKGHNYSTTLHPASCTEQGYTVYVCTVCNYTYTSDIIPAYGHNYAHDVIEPTCTTQGYTINTCKVCGYSYRSDYVPSLGHNYVTVSFDATCTEKGGIHYECDRCGDEYVVYTASALGHHYYEVRVEPTCETDGYIEHICTECDYRYKSDEQSAFGHTHLTWVSLAATCQKEGNRIHQCEICGERFVSQIPCLEHKYVITDTEVNGSVIRHYDCSECGYSRSEDNGNQYEVVTSYIEYLYEEYSPYMIWVFLSTAGVWSIAMGIAVIIAYRNEDKIKAKQMIKNYVIGLVVIFSILVAMPYLVNGIAYLITH